MPASKRPTKQQLETLEHIRQYVAKHGYSPTLADLAELASVRQNCIAERLGALVKLKLITKTPGIARSIRPVECPNNSAVQGTLDATSSALGQAVRRLSDKPS